MSLISTRIPEELEEELEWYAKREKVGKTIALRRVLDKGMKEIRIEHSDSSFKNKQDTISEKAF